MAEEGEDVAHASFEHAAEGGEFPAAFVAPRSGQVVDQLAHHAFAASPVVAPVGVYDPLVGVVGEHEVMVGLDGEQGHESGTAACAEVFVAGQQGAPAVVEPVALDTAPAGGVALQAAAHLGDAGGGQLHDVERVDDLDRVGHDGFDGLLPAGERVHGDHPDASCELAAARLHPFAKHLGGTARHHVQQSCRPAVATRGQVDDHGHVPVSERAVAPHVLVHAQRVVRRYTTTNPRTDAGRTIYRLALKLTRITTLDEAAAWGVQLHEFSTIYREWMNEKTMIKDPKTGAWTRVWTHHNVRKAYNSLNHLWRSEMLFVYLNPPAGVLAPERIKSTTNSLEGGINAQLKLLARTHRGRSGERQRRMLDWWLYLKTELPDDPVRIARQSDWGQGQLAKVSTLTQTENQADHETGRPALYDNAIDTDYTHSIGIQKGQI